MAEVVHGAAALNRRLAAISAPHGGSKFMKLAGNVVVGQMKRNIPHKTSNTSRSIHVAKVTDTSAVVEGNAVAKWIDEGTGLFGPHHARITPNAAKALRWMGGPSGSLRLSGRQRKGAVGAGAGYIFAKSTKGMEARPYVQRSVHEAGQKLGVELKGEIITLWNDAA